MTIAHLNRRFVTLAMFTVLVLLVVSVCAAPSFAQKNLVYINGNIAVTGQNAVIVLQNDGAGNLTPIAGSPFLTGGTGVGIPPVGDADWDSDGEVTINSAGTLLYAVNGHSNTFAGFAINSDGSLTALAGSPYASGGPQPASIAFKDNALGDGRSELIIVNKDSDPLQTATNPNYNSFTVSTAGIPTLNPGSTLSLAAGVSPSQALFRRGAATGFFGIEFMAGKIGSYKLTRAGIMSVTNSASMPGPSPAGVGAVLHPVVKGLYLTLPPDAKVGVYGYDATGKIGLVGTATNAGMAVCWDSINAAGNRLYTSETASGTISTYDLTNTKSPVQLQHMAVSGTGALPTHQKVDPTGKFLYVLDRLGVLHVLDVAADGTVAENHPVVNLGLPSGTVPLGVQVLLK